MKPVIVAVAYNRPDNLKRLLNGIARAEYPDDDVTLYISIDHGGINEDKVCEIAEQFVWKHGKKIIREHAENIGLKNHIIECGDLSIKHGAVIIFEDDTYPSPDFYRYTLEALDFYANEDRIFAISLYSQTWNGYANRHFEPLCNGYDAYISQIECSWGECFIGSRWEKFKEWYEVVNEKQLNHSNEVPDAVYSWEESRCKYLINYIVEKGLYYLSPYKAYSTNFNSKGTHVKRNTPTYQVGLSWGKEVFCFPSFDEAVKYDAFFESIDLGFFMKEKRGMKVCIDYYGVKKNHFEYDYVLSSVLLPYEVVNSYGLEMRPPELNVILEVPGDVLRLYDVKRFRKVHRDWTHHRNVLKYELKDLSRIDALFYSIFY